MTNRARWRIAALACVTVGVSAVGCTKAPAPADETLTAVVDVRAEELVDRSFARIVKAPGRWRTIGEVRIVAPFAAIVETLRPKVGDRVRQGAVLGSLVTRESQSAVRGAELMLAQATTDAARDEARRALALARHDLVRVPLIASADGTITQRSIEPGTEVAEGAELLILTPPATLMFEAHVPPAEASRLAVGQRATVTMGGLPSIPVTLRTRLPQSDPNDQTTLVWLAPARAVPPDLTERFGDVAIETGGAHRAIGVPDSAVVEDDLTGEHRIAVIGMADSTAVWTTIMLGIAQEGWHELLAPRLPAGTRVVVSGQRGLPDSTRVRIAP